MFQFVAIPPSLSKQFHFVTNILTIIPDISHHFHLIIISGIVLGMNEVLRDSLYDLRLVNI